MYGATDGMVWMPSRTARAPRRPTDRWRWILMLLLVSLAHLGIWASMQQARDAVAPRAAKRMTVMLVAPPSEPAAEEIAAAAPEAEPPPMPKPVPAAEPKPRPEPKPVARPVAKADPVPMQPQRAPPPVAAASALPAAPPPAEAPRYDAAYLSNDPPRYPLAARRRGLEGVVILRAEISMEGTCLQAQIKRGSGFEVLDAAALEAVRKWRFVPARRGREAQVAWVEIPITFSLEKL